MRMDILRVEGVHKRFGSVVACNDIHLELLPGTSTAIIGPNGAGKSTLLNIACGELLPDAGRVHWNGQSIIGHSVHKVARSGVTKMFQDLRLFESMTAYENVLLYARTADASQMREPAGFLPGKTGSPQRRTREVLQRMGLQKHANRCVADLSYAERKLVALGRAIVTGARLVLLDEPASGLDGHSIGLVLDMVGTLREAGALVLVVEHNLGIVEQLANRALLLEEGRVVADGSPGEVFRDSSFGRAFFSLVPAGMNSLPKEM